MISLNALKQGMAILMENQPCIILSTQHVHMGRGGAILRIKLKNLLTGATLEKTFKGNEKLEEADIQKTKVSFLYKENDKSFFMDNASFEQFFIPNDQLGEKANYLKEGQELESLNFNGQPATIDLPAKIDLRVISSPPAVKGDTAQGSGSKEIVLETGLKVLAPLFIKEGDMVKVNTETGKYVERVS